MFTKCLVDFFKLSLSIILILYKVVADIHENYFKLAMYK